MEIYCPRVHFYALSDIYFIKEKNFCFKTVFSFLLSHLSIGFVSAIAVRRSLKLVFDRYSRI